MRAAPPRADELAQLFGDRAASQIDLPESSQDVAMQTLASLAYANPEVSVTMLDYKGLQVRLLVLSTGRCRCMHVLLGILFMCLANVLMLNAGVHRQLHR